MRPELISSGKAIEINKLWDACLASMRPELISSGKRAA